MRPNGGADPKGQGDGDIASPHLLPTSDYATCGPGAVGKERTTRA
jgi:hypothetical protein